MIRRYRLLLLGTGLLLLGCTAREAPLSRRPAGPEARRPALPPSQGRVVTIIGPEGTPTYQWASPGDSVVLSPRLPFPFPYAGEAELRWHSDRDLVRVNGRVVAIDLSGLSAPEMVSRSQSALQAGAQCAFLSGSPRLKPTDLAALAHVPIRCLGFQFDPSAFADAALDLLLPLIDRVRLLDGRFGKHGFTLLARFQGLMVLRIQAAKDEDSMSRAFPIRELWSSVARLRSLESLRVERSFEPVGLLPALKALPRLHRLELPRAYPASSLAELVRLPALASLETSLDDRPQAPNQRPAAVVPSPIRELRLHVEPQYGSKSALPWLRGLAELRILSVAVVQSGDPLLATDLAPFSRLEVLQSTEHLQVGRGSPRFGALRVLLLRSLGVTTSAALTDRFPQLRRLTIVSQELVGPRARFLRALPRLEALQCLSCETDDAALIVVGRLPELRELDLGPLFVQTDGGLKRVTRVGVEALAGLKRLRTLSLAVADVGDDVLAVVGRLSALERLDLSGTRVTSAGLVHLSGLKRLRWLSLNGTDIDSAGVSHLRSLSQLRHLNLSTTAVDDAALSAMAALDHLQELSLEGTEVTGATLTALSALPDLRVLVLGHATVASGTIASAGLPACLEVLDLSFIPLTDADLTTVGRLPSLQDVGLVNCGITDVSLGLVTPAPQLGRMTLSFNQGITNASLARLAQLPRLRQVVLSDTRVTSEAVKDLEQKHPHLMVVHH